MLQKLTSTTCTLAMLLCMPSPTYADGFDDAILDIVKTAIPGQSSSHSSATANAYEVNADGGFLEQRVQNAFDQYRGRFVSGITAQILSAGQRVDDIYRSNTPGAPLDETLLFANAERDLLFTLRDYRLNFFLPQVKGNIDTYWLLYTLLFSTQEENRRLISQEQTVWANHQSRQSSSAVANFQALIGTLEEEIEGLSAQISHATNTLWQQVDHLLRGRSLPNQPIHPVAREHSLSFTQADEQAGSASTSLIGSILTFSTDLAVRVANSVHRKANRYVNGKPVFHNDDPSNGKITAEEQAAHDAFAQLPEHPEEPSAEFVARVVAGQGYLSVPKALRRPITSQLEASVYHNNPQLAELTAPVRAASPSPSNGWQDFDQERLESDDEKSVEQGVQNVRSALNSSSSSRSSSPEMQNENGGDVDEFGEDWQRHALVPYDPDHMTVEAFLSQFITAERDHDEEERHSEDGTSDNEDIIASPSQANSGQVLSRVMVGPFSTHLTALGGLGGGFQPLLEQPLRATLQGAIVNENSDDEDGNRHQHEFEDLEHLQTAALGGGSLIIASDHDRKIVAENFANEMQNPPQLHVLNAPPLVEETIVTEDDEVKANDTVPGEQASKKKKKKKKKSPTDNTTSS